MSSAARILFMELLRPTQSLFCDRSFPSNLRYIAYCPLMVLSKWSTLIVSHPFSGDCLTGRVVLKYLATRLVLVLFLREGCMSIVTGVSNCARRRRDEFLLRVSVYLVCSP